VKLNLRRVSAVRVYGTADCWPNIKGGDDHRTLARPAPHTCFLRDHPSAGLRGVGRALLAHGAYRAPLEYRPAALATLDEE
jgi:hypothetical protein